MGYFITPKHSGSIDNFLYPLLVLQKNGIVNWMTTEEFKNELFKLYVENNVNNEWEVNSEGKKVMKHDSSDYTKDLQLPAYFGFTEADSFQRNSSKRITKLGIKLLDAYKSAGDSFDSDLVKDIFLESMESVSFGKNNYGVINSDSDLEAPAIFLKSSILLDGLTNNEFAYIIDKLENYHKDYSEVIMDVKRRRLKDLPFSSSISTDIKFLTFFRNIGIIVSGQTKNSYCVCDYYLRNQYERVSALPIFNNDKEYTSLNQFANQNKFIATSIEDMNDKTKKYLTAICTKPFLLLAGISGTGKSRIVRKLAQASITEDVQKLYDPKSIENGFKRWELHKPANFELVQVKPNWHNSLEVVGYKSNIGGAHYEFTPFVEFVVRAWKHQDVPFFLCLDEMNLAPAEQYFAEFLSAIESRSIENDEYETDPIIKPFIDFGDEVCRQMIDHLVGKVDASKVIPDSIEAKLVERFKTKGLTLPKNLFVLGTVNMDETTFSFSRKVLDRAMSIVMNDVEYDKFFRGETENDIAEFDNDTKKLLIDRPIRGLEAEENGAELVEQYLTAINEKLNNTPFKLGYRAANEALLYVSAAHHFDSSLDVNSALDEFTLMKILSRIEGDKRSIGNLLQDLQQVINESYPASNKKLVQMAETLQDKQFVSYWT